MTQIRNDQVLLSAEYKILINIKMWPINGKSMLGIKKMSIRGLTY